MSKRKITRTKIISGSVCVAFIIAFFYVGFCPAYVLSIKDISNGRIIIEKATIPGDNLWIVFINSVENLPVADHFRVNEDFKIVFTETIFQAPYAGYDLSEKAELIAPGTTRIAGYNRPMEAYTFYAGAISKHMLFLNGSWLPLYTIARGGDLIQITVQKRSRLSLLIKPLGNSPKDVLP